MDVKHWIRAAHKLEVDWNYQETIDSGNIIIKGIEERFLKSLENKTQTEFRSYIYSRLGKLSGTWEDLSSDNLEVVQMGAFSREIATWICEQNGDFNPEGLYDEVINTRRKINSTILKYIAADVMGEMFRINQSKTLMEAAS